MPTANFSWSAPPDLDRRVRARLDLFRRQDIPRRIFDRDATVWSSADEGRWLGWLTLPEQTAESRKRATDFAAQIAQEKISAVVLLGMGGSSLAPEVMRSILGRGAGCPELHVVDSTDPSQIAAVERAVDFAQTLFLVASKSGSTLEVNILRQYFFDRVAQRFGAAEAGHRFAVTTDPGSKMEQIAAQEQFRAVFPGIPEVGGRYSALSNFGLIPAALIGTDIGRFLERAQAMATACRSQGDDNTALELGVFLGELALAGRDKPTLIAPPALSSFGAWLEQLVAESLGKQGKGIIPIEGEIPGAPDVYGADRVFVHLRSTMFPYPEGDAAAARLEQAGHPLVRIDWPDRLALGAEFFRWEFATAVAGAVLGVNPFDQPDVEAAKIITRGLATEYERTGKLPDAEPVASDAVLDVFAPADLRSRLETNPSPAACIQALLRDTGEGDYFAILAFIEMSAANRDPLEAMRGLVRDRRKVATTVGFGPRYLHSTGQAHKGGPDSGVFLIITCNEKSDLAVPGQRYSFGTIKLAQARGDAEVLSSRGRRLLRVHLKDVASGLSALYSAVEAGVQ